MSCNGTGGPGQNNSGLAARLGRSVSSLQFKAAKLGLKEPLSCRQWTPQENEFLREMVGRIPAREIARRTGRTETAVKARAVRIGASWRERDGWYTAGEVARILGADPHWVGARIGDGTLRASPVSKTIPRKAAEIQRKMGKGGPNTWRIERKDLRDFLMSYPHELSGRNVDIIQIVEILAGLEGRGN